MGYPNKSLSNFELMEMTKNLPHFRGVFMRDHLPKKPRKNECAILNLDDKNGAGTHWTCWFKRGNTRIYFDSYGVITPIELQTYLKRSNEGPCIQRSTDEIQPRGTSICGYLCIEVLKRLSNGESFLNVLQTLNKKRNVSKQIWSKF